MLVEFVIALQLRLIELGLRLVSGKRRFGLREGGEKRTLVQRDQQVALANELSLLVMHFLDDSPQLAILPKRF